MTDTPAAKWRENGEDDPHGNRYDCKRSDLAMGNLTDDELADSLLVGSDLAFQTAAKDRIRWLSRQVEDLKVSHAAAVEKIKAKIKRFDKKIDTATDRETIALNNRIRGMELALEILKGGGQ